MVSPPEGADGTPPLPTGLCVRPRLLAFVPNRSPTVTARFRSWPPHRLPVAPFFMKPDQGCI